MSTSKEQISNWLPPRAILATFCALNLLIYADRGAFSSNGINADGMKSEFSLSMFQDGLLPAAFMVGLLVSSPIFAEASKHAGAFRLIGVGLSVWSVAVAGCGLSLGFISLLFCRMAVGVGEASFVSLAAPFIDDNAPPERKTGWLATFYLCIPVGYALGFVYGGLVASTLGWRAAFLLQALAMVPFIALCFRAPNIDLRGTHQAAAHDARTEATHPSTLFLKLKEAGHDVMLLTERPVYLATVAGMVPFTAVLGSLAFFGPQAALDIFDVDPKVVDLTFGGMTVTTGIVGTLCGGLVLDRVGSTMKNGLLLCASGLAAGCACFLTAFAFAGSFVPFCVLVALGEAALFSTQAPANAVSMWCVPPGLRPLGVSMSVVVMHLLGDVPAPPLLGLLQGKVQNWRVTMSVLAALLALGVVSYAVGGLVYGATAVDFRTVETVLGEEDEEAESGEGRSLMEPEDGGSSETLPLRSLASERRPAVVTAAVPLFEAGEEFGVGEAATPHAQVQVAPKPPKERQD